VAKGGLGLHYLYASVISDNAPSIKLFEGCGFERVAEIPHFYRFSGTTYSKLVFNKRL